MKMEKKNVIEYSGRCDIVNHVLYELETPFLEKLRYLLKCNKNKTKICNM